MQAKGWTMRSTKSRRIKRSIGSAKNNISVRVKLWLEISGEPFFGEGRVQLLKGIDQYGSINKAARAAKIPYRKAWSYLHRMENRLGIKMMSTQVGGANGGWDSAFKGGKGFSPGRGGNRPP